MCLILDANRVADVLGKTKPEFAELREAILEAKHNVCLVIGGEVAREYAKMTKYAGLLADLSRQGTLRREPNEPVDAEEARVAAMNVCVSDDPHVIALALVARVRLLCTNDTNLKTDFDNPALISNPRGRIYSAKHHRDLLDCFCARPQKAT